MCLKLSGDRVNTPQLSAFKMHTASRRKLIFTTARADRSSDGGFRGAPSSHHGFMNSPFAS